MTNIAVFDYQEQDWAILNSEEDFLAQYPQPEYGKYRPQPWAKPERYPCLFKEIARIDPRGADHAILAYIYDFKPNFKE